MRIKSVKYQTKIIFVISILLVLSVLGLFNIQKVFAGIFSFTQNMWTISDSTQIATKNYASSTWGYYSTSSGPIYINQNKITLVPPTRIKTISGNELTTNIIDTGVQFSSTTFVGPTSTPINGSTNVVALVDIGVKRDDLVVKSKTGFSFYNLQGNTWKNTNVTFNGLFTNDYSNITFGDVDEDGDHDALVLFASSLDTEFFRNNNGIFSKEPVANLGLGVGVSSSTEKNMLNGSYSKSFEFFDADNNGRIDYLIMGIFNQDHFKYIRNISTTTGVNFDNPIDEYLTTPYSMSPQIPIRPRMTFQDLNGDGISDLVLGEASYSQSYSNYSGRLFVYLNNGNEDNLSFDNNTNDSWSVYGWDPEYTVSQQRRIRNYNNNIYKNPHYKEFHNNASAAFGDFNGDTISDLVITDEAQDLGHFTYYIGTTTLNVSTGLYEWKGIPHSSISPLITFSNKNELVSPVLSDLISDQTYLNVGDYISPQINGEGQTFFKSLSVAKSTPSGTNIALKARTGTITGGGSSVISQWQDIGINGEVNATSSAQFIQFKADLTTDNTSKTPSFGSATIQYTTAANGTLLSSPFNTEEKYTILSSVIWDENTPLGTSVTVSLRSASSTEDLVTAPWENFTNSTAGCSKASVTVTCNTLPSSLRTGNNDQFFQYRISMTSDGLYSPEVSKIKINYNVNAAPTISSFTVSQIATSTDPDLGKIRVNYALQDVDTQSNSVNVTLEYATGTTWNFLSRTTRTLSQVHTETFNREAFPSQSYNSALKLRITINDDADVNNISLLENTFALDTKSPTIITSRVDSRLDQLNLIATDESGGLQMRISNYNDFRDTTVWEQFATSVAWIATSSSDGMERVYLEIRDRLGNISSKMIEISAPPTTLNAKDISNASTNEYRIQLLWASSTDANFLNYQIYRKSNVFGDTTYRLISPSITNPEQNSYVDTNLSSSRLYYYRVVIEDTNHNISNYSPEVMEQPDDIYGPSIQFENTNGNSLESIPTKVIPIKISAVTPQPVSVSYTVYGGNATRGTDYTMDTGTVTIPAGQTSTTISFSVIDDLLYENNETFTVTLSNPQESRLGTNTSYTHTINNNDFPPSISFLNTSSTVGEDGKTIIIPVVLSTISGATTSVGFSLGGTASLGIDYTVASIGNTLVIPQGTTTTLLVVTTIDDTTYEENKSVTITLLPNNDVTLGSPASFTFSIIESSPFPFVEFDAYESSSNENDGVNNEITLTVSSAFPTPVDIFYTIEGTAHGSFETKTRDDMWIARYSLPNTVVEVGVLRRKSGFVTIPAGVTHIALPLTLLNNNSYQGDETIIVTLTTPENASYRIRNKITHTHTIHDDDTPPQVRWNIFERISPEIEIISPLHIKVKENIHEQIELKTRLSSALEKNIEIPFVITGVDGDSRFITQQNTIVIPAGSEGGNMIISFLNNGIYEGNKDIQITLQSSESATIDSLHNVFLITIVEDDEPVHIDFKNPSQTILESDSVTVEIPVVLSSVIQRESTIFFTVGGTFPSEQVRIVSETSSLVIPHGAQEGIIKLLVSGDQIYRGNETIVVSLSSSQGVQLGTRTQHIITVEDNDLPPSVAFTSENQNVSENNGNISAQILLSEPSSFPIQVSFAISGTAIQGQDYIIEGSSVSIPSGSINASIPITLINDAVYYGTRTLTLTLSSSNFAQLGLHKVHTITITDDEVPLDITSPVIFNIKPPVVTDALAIFEWDTDEQAKGSVMWGTESEHLTEIAKEDIINTHHFVALSNLTASTIYYYAFHVIDNAGNSTVTGEQFFNTLASTTQNVSQEVYDVLANQYEVLQVQYTELASSTVTLTQYEVLQNQFTQISNELQALQDQIGGGSGTSTSTGAISEEEFNALQTLTDQLQDQLNSAEGNAAELAAMRQSYATLQTQLSVMRLEVEKAKNKIEKDIIPPVIHDVNIKNIGAFDATITWHTDEPASSFVSYQEVSSTTTSTLSVGSPLLVTDHSIKLSRLTTATQYQFSVLSSDNFSNISSSTSQTFKTLFVTETLEDLVQVGDVEQFQEQLGKFIESTTPSLIPPVIADVEVVSVGEKDAQIQWRTNVEGSSIIAFVPDVQYKENATSTYTFEIGNSEAKEKNHTVLLTGLMSGTKYHFQVKTQTIVGIIGKSNDFTFTTRFEKPEVSVSEIGEKDATVAWITTRPTTSYVEYKDIKTGKVTKKGEETPVRSHVMRVSNLTPDTSYEIRAYGKDSEENTLETKQVKFHTKIDRVPPKIANLRIENALIPNRTDRLQTIIFWTTDEPATSQVLYEEGAGSGTQLSQKTEITDLLTTNHVVVLNSFQPQMVYRIQAISMDHAGNRASSSIRSFLTPQKGESILDIISKNFEQSFGWLKELR